MEAGFDFFATKNPSADALIDPAGRRWSRGEVDRLVNQTARAFRELGLAGGDVIALLSRNRAEFLLTYLAALRSGLYLVPINWHLASAELAYILRDSGAKAVVADSRLAALTGDALRREPELNPVRISFGPAPGFQEFDELIRPQSVRPLEPGPIGQVLQYTSATTGRPKGVLVPPISPRLRDLTIGLQVSLGVGVDDGNVNLCLAPLYHSAPLAIAITALDMGHAVHLVDGFEPEACLQILHTHRSITSFMVPMMFLRFLKLSPEVRARYSTASLRWVVHGGAPCAIEVKRQIMEWWGPVLWDCYGSTEGGGGTMCSPQEWLKFPGTVGRPARGTECRILDEKGREVPAGQVGTIYMTRPTGDRFSYKGDPQKTGGSYRGEFFTVGDLGYLNEEGYLFICDRKVDTILSGGVKIFSAEVEQALVLHPMVADCAVVGIPDAVLGEAVKAFVQLAPDVEASSNVTRELIGFLGTRLAPIKLPRRFEYRRELPRDPSGKLYKRQLRAVTGVTS